MTEKKLSLKRSLPRDIFIPGQWYFCKEASLVWYLWTG